MAIKVIKAGGLFFLCYSELLQEWGGNKAEEQIALVSWGGLY